MFVASYRNTMRNARIVPTEETHALREQRASLERECALRRAEVEAATERLNALRQQANEAIQAANRALAVLRAADEMTPDKPRRDRCAPQPMTIEQVATRICRAVGATKEEIQSDRRDKGATFIRQAVCYWAMRRTRKASTQIGRYLGNRDHSTILHGCDAYVVKRANMGRTLRPVRRLDSPLMERIDG